MELIFGTCLTLYRRFHHSAILRLTPALINYRGCREGPRSFHEKVNILLPRNVPYSQLLLVDI